MKKKSKTKKEKEHLSKVAALGCLICQRPANCHHIRPIGLGIGRRSSHFETIPLCVEHHTGEFSIHNCKKEFESRYGTEEQLLQKTLREINKLEQVNNFYNVEDND